MGRRVICQSITRSVSSSHSREPSPWESPLPSRTIENYLKQLHLEQLKTPEQIETRIVTAAREMELWRDYRYTIISKSMEEDLLKFRNIMGAERYLSRRLKLS